MDTGTNQQISRYIGFGKLKMKQEEYIYDRNTRKKEEFIEDIDQQYEYCKYWEDCECCEDHQD